MHPDKKRINQIIVKVKTPQQITSCLTELTGLIRNDIAQVAADKSTKAEYFREFETFVKSVTVFHVKERRKSTMSCWASTLF